MVLVQPVEEDVAISSQQNDVAQSPSQEKQQSPAEEGVAISSQQNDIAQSPSHPADEDVESSPDQPNDIVARAKRQKLADEEVETSRDQQNDDPQAKMGKKEKNKEKTSKKKQISEEQNEGGKMGKDQEASSEEPLVLDEQNQKDINEKAAKLGADLERAIDKAGIGESCGLKSIHESADEEPAEGDVAISSQQNDVPQSPSHEKTSKVLLRKMLRSRLSKMMLRKAHHMKNSKVLLRKMLRSHLSKNDGAQSPSHEKQQSPADDDVESSLNQQNDTVAQAKRHMLANENAATSLVQKNDADAKRQKLADENVETSRDQQNDDPQAKMGKTQVE